MHTLFTINSVVHETRTVSVVFHTGDGDRLNNIVMAGPVAGLLDLTDGKALNAYLAEFGDTYYRQAD